MFLGGCVIGGLLVMAAMTLCLFIERHYFDGVGEAVKAIVDKVCAWYVHRP